ncbi:MAG: tetratricopeptide repeat protein [Elusimicrobiota bacterium]|jgi:tetratricopeptide (TPR) repeat protein|nr:tetratricopeptide repeat protein [Elusimicrobiota bacterium]
MKNKIKKYLTISFAVLFLSLQSDFSFAQSYDAYRIYIKALLEQISGQSSKAKQSYEEAIKLDENAVAIYKDLTYLDWTLGDKENAMELAKKIEDIDGEDPDTTLFLAGFYLMTNTTDSAKTFWNKTLKLDPKNETALSSLASFYYNDNDFQESQKYWKEFLKLDPQSAIGNFQLGVVQEKLGMNSAALESYDKVIKERPEVIDIYVAKARIYENSGKMSEAVKVFENFYKDYPDNPFVLVYLGRVYYMIGDMPKSEEILLKAKIVLPDDFNTAFWLGMVYERTGQIPKAIKEFELILKFASQGDNLTIISKLGYYYAVSGQYSKAENYLIRALKLDSSNADLLYLTALNYMDAGRYTQAIEYFHKSISARENFDNAYFYLANAYDRKGDWENAQETLLKLLEMSPNDARAMNYLGLVYANRGINLTVARNLLEKALSIEKDNGMYIDTLGWIYFKEGQFANAEQLLVTAANMTRHPNAYHHLGDAYSAQNKNADAWIAYSLAYDVNSDKNIKRKLDIVQNKLSNIELADRMLFRCDSHYLKLFSLKTGFKAQAGNLFLKKSMYFSFIYVKGEAIEIGIPVTLMPDAKIFIKDSKIIFYPQMLENSIQPEIADLINAASQIFKSGFVNGFKRADIQRKGNDMIYSIGSDKLTLNINDSLIKEIVKGDITIQILEYKSFAASKIPSKIKVMSKQFNYNITFEASPFNFANEHIIMP